MEASSVAEAGIPGFATLYAHIRVILGIVVGLGLTHLLRNLARVVDEPREDRLYWIHLTWVLFAMLYLLHFWWWEFRISHTSRISFFLFLYLISYTLTLYFLCALLFPEKNSDPKDYRVLFYERRKWFFAVLALVFLIDIGDSLLKGMGYLLGLGHIYLYRNLLFFVACLVAIATRSPRYHATFAVSGILFQIYWLFGE
ncbi:hypothetical protein SAMN04487965_3166 [Microbulbifer donghaiensis]|uniref:Uncharacterized protein n=1 Tax=Microbulbifer donghaiensis TaxID=494016 RepID=A0A1M5GJS1_9GAMM|nr:hypothetical protein [Microbulbifer donghaiensis]SHG03969.1 hypothetical protein SAMN04487965_3166 [Microbulbifer donghaiensis]